MCTLINLIWTTAYCHQCCFIPQCLLICFFFRELGFLAEPYVVFFQPVRWELELPFIYRGVGWRKTILAITSPSLPEDYIIANVVLDVGRKIFFFPAAGCCCIVDECSMAVCVCVCRHTVCLDQLCFRSLGGFQTKIKTQGGISIWETKWTNVMLISTEWPKNTIDVLYNWGLLRTDGPPPPQWSTSIRFDKTFDKRSHFSYCLHLASLESIVIEVNTFHKPILKFWYKKPRTTLLNWLFLRDFFNWGLFGDLIWDKLW